MTLPFAIAGADATTILDSRELSFPPHSANPNKTTYENKHKSTATVTLVNRVTLSLHTGKIPDHSPGMDGASISHHGMPDPTGLNSASPGNLFSASPATESRHMRMIPDYGGETIPKTVPWSMACIAAAGALFHRRRSL